MKLLKEFKKVFAVTAIAVMSLISLPIGSAVEAATTPKVTVKSVSGENGWVLQADSVVNPLYEYNVTIEGTASQITEMLKSQKPMKVVLENFKGSVNLVLKSYTTTTINALVQIKNIKGLGINKRVRIEPSIGGVGYSSYFTIKARDTQKPELVVSNPTPSTVKQSQTIVMTIAATDNVGVEQFNISNQSIVLNGFTADKKLTGTGNFRTLTLSNIQGTAGEKSIYISGAILADAGANFGDAVTKTFTLIENVIEDPNKDDDKKQDDDKTTDNTNNNDNSNTSNANANNNTGTNAGNIIINNNNNITVDYRPADWRPNPNTGLAE